MRLSWPRLARKLTLSTSRATFAACLLILLFMLIHFSPTSTPRPRLSAVSKILRGSSSYWSTPEKNLQKVNNGLLGASVMIQRPANALTGAADLEPLFSFSRFPAYMGTGRHPPAGDAFFAMNWMISPTTGVVQLNPVLPLQLVYQKQHNAVIGATWVKHHQAFGEFIRAWLAPNGPKSVVEIGGGHGYLAKMLLKPHIKWRLVDPNPTAPKLPNLYTYEMFMDTFQEKHPELLQSAAVLIHSHLIEHLYYPLEFMQGIARSLSAGMVMAFSVPNMYEMVKRDFAYIHTEHTVFLRPEHTEWLMQAAGFKLLKRQLYGIHSIFYAFERTADSIDAPIPGLEPPPNFYAEHKALFGRWESQLKSDVDIANRMLEGHKNGPTYIFSAHVFTQYMVAAGLREDLLTAILDNDPLKQGTRLIGSSLVVLSPQILERLPAAFVILRAGPYSNEIKQQLLMINPGVNILCFHCN